MADTDIINNPILRFPEFNDGKGWAISSIGDLFVSLPTASYSRAFLIENGSIRYIHYGDIHTKFNTFIDISKDQLPFIPADLKKRYHLVKDGDLVLTDASEDYTGIGKAVEIINVGKRKAICGLHTILLRGSKQVFYTGFKTYLFQSPRVKKQIERLSVGFKVNSISFNAIKDVHIIYPHNKKEQEKISKCLQSIEYIIATNEKELFKLLEHRKSLFQKIFNLNNINIFDNVLSSDRMSDHFSRIIKKNNGESTNILTISAQNGIVSQTNFYNKNIAAEDISNYTLIEKGDFVFNKSRSIGYPYGAIKQLKRYKKGIVSPIYLCFRLKTKDNPTFFEYYFETIFFQKKLSKVVQEGARHHGLLNIAINDFFNISISVPSINIQDVIAGTLESVDSLIELKKKKIEILKTYKKGLLQKLFPTEF